MTCCWRTMELFLPRLLSGDQAGAELRTRMLHAAADCGEFVHDIRIEGSQPHGDDWRKWRVSYLPGPPGADFVPVFPPSQNLNSRPRCQNPSLHRA